MKRRKREVGPVAYDRDRRSFRSTQAVRREPSVLTLIGPGRGYRREGASEPFGFGGFGDSPRLDARRLPSACALGRPSSSFTRPPVVGGGW